MRVFLLLIGLITFVFSSNAQQISVFEQGSKFPIENVSIYNKTNSTIVYTNKKGIADLSVFEENDILIFACGGC